MAQTHQLPGSDSICFKTRCSLLDVAAGPARTHRAGVRGLLHCRNKLCVTQASRFMLPSQGLNRCHFRQPLLQIHLSAALLRTKLPQYCSVSHKRPLKQQLSILSITILSKPLCTSQFKQTLGKTLLLRLCCSSFWKPLTMPVQRIRAAAYAVIFTAPSASSCRACGASIPLTC